MALRLWLLLSASVAFGKSPYLFLFETARERMQLTLEGQKAREALANATYQRAARLLSSNAIAREEFEQLEAAETLARLDVAIAEIKVKQADIAYVLMKDLSAAGRRIPVCRRKIRKPRPEMTSLVKIKKRPPPAPLQEPNPGTQIKLQPEAPEPAPIPDPKPAPDPQPDPAPQPGPQNPGPDVPDPDPGSQNPKPNPKPDPKPNPKPNPKPPPGGGGER